MTEIMPVPRIMSFTVLPAGRFWYPLFYIGPLKAAKKTALIFLDLSRVARKPNANPHYLTNFVCSTDFLQVLKRNCHHI